MNHKRVGRVLRKFGIAGLRLRKRQVIRDPLIVTGQRSSVCLLPPQNSPKDLPGHQPKVKHQ
ncbi:hypothetical protein [Streptomyces ipomoeae]|uniref:hypothetical protein n=1 Tax=Streptomyces ipomoeae TaxID=103232 RepID=UPI0029BFC277|nr:hypothetical protein [Streptomyces ipomoeae]